MSEQAINEKMRNEFASHGLEILKLAVLHVLYEAYKKRNGADGSLATWHIIHQLGMEDVTGSRTLVRGVLYHLREDDCVKEAGYQYWIITEEGISVIEG